jgi:hypothetical protein
MRALACIAFAFLMTGAPLAQQAEVPSVPHVICSAYDATLARELAHAGLTTQSTKIGEWAEAHAAAAIALDKLDRLPAWASRDLISQLTERFRAQAATHEGMLELSKKHEETCVALAKRMGEVMKDIASRRQHRNPL